MYGIENFTPVTDEGDALDIWSADWVGLEKLPAATSVVVTSEWAANLPGLAAVYLGSKYLWWVLLHYNGLYDAVFDIKPGITLRVPDRDMLMTYMEQRRALRKNSSVQLVTTTVI